MGHTDWRGQPLQIGDTVFYTYAWGGQKLGRVEGVIVNFVDTKTGDTKIVLHYDDGDYIRRRRTVTRWAHELVKLEPRPQ